MLVSFDDDHRRTLDLFQQQMKSVEECGTWKQYLKCDNPDEIAATTSNQFKSTDSKVKKVLPVTEPALPAKKASTRTRSSARKKKEEGAQKTIKVTRKASSRRMKKATN
jgi:hypothetical protein